MIEFMGKEPCTATAYQVGMETTGSGVVAWMMIYTVII